LDSSYSNNITEAKKVVSRSLVQRSLEAEERFLGKRYLFAQTQRGAIKGTWLLPLSTPPDLLVEILILFKTFPFPKFPLLLTKTFIVGEQHYQLFKNFNKNCLKS